MAQVQWENVKYVFGINSLIVLFICYAPNRNRDKEVKEKQSM